MRKSKVLAGIGIGIAAIIIGIFVGIIFSEGMDIAPEPEINDEAEPGKVIGLRLGESVSMGESP